MAISFLWAPADAQAKKREKERRKTAAEPHTTFPWLTSTDSITNSKCSAPGSWRCRRPCTRTDATDASLSADLGRPDFRLVQLPSLVPRAARRMQQVRMDSLQHLYQLGARGMLGFCYQWGIQWKRRWSAHDLTPANDSGCRKTERRWR